MSSKAGDEGESDKETVEAAPSVGGSKENLDSAPELGTIDVCTDGLKENEDEKASEGGTEGGSGSESDEESEYDSEYDSENEGGYIFPTKSLARLAEEAVIKSLSKAIDGEQVTARYCCGGRIPAIEPELEMPDSKDDIKTGEEEGKESGGEAKIDEKAEDKKDQKDEMESKDSKATPVQPTPVIPEVMIRWDDPRNPKLTRRLTIASSNSLGDLEKSQRSALTRACGSRGLDQSKFTVDFHPQDHGILDAVTQILLPSWKGSFLANYPENRGVKVERCRLHVSSEKVESRISMASRPGLLGRLIVCLTNTHKGGKLTLSSDGHSSVFDWSSSEDPVIHWVAFTKECSLEFSPVTEGIQILLVYNLVVTKRVGDGVGSGSVIDPTLSPLYRGVRDMLLEPGFMKKGGTLGYYCRYPYSHTSPHTAKGLPRALRGVDMVFYSVFKSLGFKPQVRPILDPADIQSIEEDRMERECCGDWEEYDQWMDERGGCQGAMVGEAFHGIRIGGYASMYDECYDPDSFDENLAATWPLKERFGITWLNTPWSGGKKPRELAVVMEEDSFDDGMCGCLRCRHTREAQKLHSLVGMLVVVPKLADRNFDI